MCVGLGWVSNGSVAASPPVHGLTIQNKTSTRQRTLGRGQGPPGTHRLLCLIAPAWAATVQGVQWAEPRVPGREAAVACLPTATSLTWLSSSQVRQPHCSTNSKSRGPRGLNNRPPWAGEDRKGIL